MGSRRVSQKKLRISQRHPKPSSRLTWEIKQKKGLVFQKSPCTFQTPSLQQLSSQSFSRNQQLLHRNIRFYPIKYWVIWRITTDSKTFKMHFHICFKCRTTYETDLNFTFLVLLDSGEIVTFSVVFHFHKKLISNEANTLFISLIWLTFRCSLLNFCCCDPSDQKDTII